jgi:hypothetical protein
MSNRRLLRRMAASEKLRAARLRGPARREAGPQERLVFTGNTVPGIGGRVVRHQARPATVAGSAGPC